MNASFQKFSSSNTGIKNGYTVAMAAISLETI